MENFTLTGVWWLPGSEGQNVSGTLNFRAKGQSSLELIGTLNNGLEALNASLNQPSKFDVVHGMADGKLVTLLDCWEVNTKMSMPGIVRSTYLPSVVVTGANLEMDDARYSELSVLFSNIEDWVRISGFTSNTIHDTDKNFKQHVIAYSFPDTIAAQAGDTLVTFDYNFSTKMELLKSVHMEQKVLIKFRPPEAQDLNEYLSGSVYHVRNFLSLGIGLPVYCLEISGTIEAAEKDDKPVEVEIYYSDRNFPDEISSIHQWKMLFTLNDIRSSLSEYLTNWVCKAERLKPVYDLYFGTLYHTPAFLEFRFLNMIQAVESYHRRMIGGQYVDDNSFAPICATLQAAIPSELEYGFRESMKGKIKYFNEFSLRKRLKDILDRCSNAIANRIHNPNRFLEDVLNTRNYLTHYDETLGSKAKSGRELYEIIQNLQLILEICFLTEIGFPDCRVADLIQSRHV